MPGFKIVASLLTPDGYEATLEGVTAAQDEATKEVPVEFVAGQKKVLNWTLKRVAGSGGKDVIATSSAAPWSDALSQSVVPDADVAAGPVSGTWAIDVPTDATAATIPVLTLAFNEAA